MIRVVIVDVDDTLCMTEGATFAMENDVLRQIGQSPMSREVHKKTWGMPLIDALELRSPGASYEAFMTAFRPTIDEYVRTGKLDMIPKANYDTLDALIRNGKSIVLLTSRNHTELKHLMAPDHLLAGRVSAFYYRDNMQYHKPDPRAFDALLHERKLQPGECVYVGDAQSDATAASGAGVHFIASLESGLRQASDFERVPVDAFIHTFPELVPAVEALDRQLTVPA